MPQETSSSKQSANGQSTPTAAATDVVTQIVRNAAAEVIKGQQPLNEVVRKVVTDAVETIEKRGPKFAEDAGILNWRYAVLGYVTWQVGKRVIKRKAKQAVGRGSGRGTQVERSTDG
jgi:hypothetical protein